ncbi:hypothetical protein SAMN04487881_0057 [Marinobacter sp. es.048]|nr:hypothetical protein SAMN04487881_0057 [Marinobacter sp. es.048]
MTMRSSVADAPQMLENLIQPPPDRRFITQIAPVIAKILGVMREMPLSDYGLDDISGCLDEMTKLCQAIELGEELVPSAWTEKPVFSRGSYITDYPLYAALDHFSRRSEYSPARVVLAAHVILSIYMGRPVGAEEEVSKPIPETNILSACREIRLLQDRYLQRLGDVSIERQAVYEDLEAFIRVNPKGIPPKMLGRFRNVKRVIGLSLGHERPEKRTRGPSGPRLYVDVCWQPGVSDIDPDDGLKSETMPTIAAHSHTDEETLHGAVQEGLSTSDVVSTNTVQCLNTRYASKKGESPEHGLYQQRAVANQIKRQAQLLPARWGQLSELDCVTFLDWVTQEVNPVTVALLLSFVTGRPLDQVAETKLVNEDSLIPQSHAESYISLCAESQTWISKPPLPERTRSMRANWHQNLAPTTENLMLPIPDLLWELLNQFLEEFSGNWAGNLFTKAQKRSLITRAKEALRDGIRRKDAGLTVTRIQRHLFNLLVSRGGDIADAVLITGTAPPYGQATALYYYQADVGHLECVYLDAMDRVPGLQRRNPDSMRQAKMIEESVGSPFYPRPERLPFLVSDLTAELERLRSMPPSRQSLADFHNSYTVYTALFAAFATGYRSVKFPVSRESDIDEKSGFLVVADKVGDDMSHSRLVPLVPVLLEHLRLYREHRETLIRRLWGFQKQPAPEHFMFFVSRKNTEVSPITPSTLGSHAQWAYDLPLNANRHFLRTELRARGVSGEHVDVFMGHWSQGQEPYGKFSSFSYRDYRSQIVPVLEKIVADMGWEPREGRL